MSSDVDKPELPGGFNNPGLRHIASSSSRVDRTMTILGSLGMLNNVANLMP